MSSKLLNENKKPLSENQHFKSFQTLPVPPRTEMGQKVVSGFTPPIGKKELDWQIKEIAALHEYKLLKHQKVPCRDYINNLKVCLQESLKRLEEKKRDLIKEKRKILVGRELVLQQDKILEDMQIKINHLHKQLKRPELIGLKKSKELKIQIETLGAGSRQEGEKIYKCPSTPTQETAMVKETQKSMTGYLKKFCFFLRKSVWPSVRPLLYGGGLCLTLLLVYKHLIHPTRMSQLDILDNICHHPWTH